LFGTLFHRLAPGLAVLAVLAPDPGLAAPKTRVEPSVIELGTIQEGNEFERFLTVTNAGDGVLVIQDVKTSCGCTAAGVEGSVELKAGESKEVRVTFNSRGMDGQVTKKVTVFTNDPENASTIVELKANVHQPVRWEPKYITLDRVHHRDAFEQKVRLEADHELGLQVKDAFILGGRTDEKESRIFDLETGKLHREGDRDVVDFVVKLRPDQPPRRLAETLVVLTNLADRDTLKLSIRGELLGRITVKPAFAVLRLVNPGEESVRDVTLTADEGTFKVVSAEIEDSPIGVEVFEEKAGQQATVRLTYIGEAEGTSGVKTLKIVTDDPDQGVIEVPVRYHTRASVQAAVRSGEG